MADSTEGDELTGGDVSRILRISRQQVNRLAHDGKLAGYQVAGRYWVFKREDVLAYQRAAKPKGGRPTGPMYGKRGAS